MREKGVTGRDGGHWQPGVHFPEAAAVSCEHVGSRSKQVGRQVVQGQNVWTSGQNGTLANMLVASQAVLPQSQPLAAN